MIDESPQRRGRPTYLVLALLGGLVLAVAVLVRLVSEDRRYQVVPSGVAGQLAVIAVAALAAVTFAAVGRRWLNPLCGVLMGLVGSAIVATVAPSAPAFVLGALAGAVVALAWTRFFMLGVVRVLIGLTWTLAFTALGVLGGGVARSLAIDNGRSDWTWPVIATFVFATGQLVVLSLWFGNRLRRSRTTNGRSRVLSTCAMLIPLILLIPIHWQLGWYGELVRRLRSLESDGVSLDLDWKKASFRRLLWRGPMVPMQYHSGPSKVWHWATIHDLAPIGDLTLHSPEITDDNQAMGTSSCSAFQVVLENTQITGKMFEEKERFPRIMSLAIYSSPVDDEGLENICQLNSLSWIALVDTRVTEAGLAPLGKLEFLTTLVVQRDSIGPVAFGHLAKVTSLRQLVITGSQTKVSGLENVAAMPQLSELTIQSPVIPSELNHLQNCPVLYKLSMRIESLSPEMIAVLQKLQANKVSLIITTSSAVDARKLRQLFPRAHVIKSPPD